ncbi:MAG TPA: SMP-30/gluconolactonase/LRE family protein [Aliidongia sp.]|uniref:SMP-30/gluconolactonase/LRE family protein n=1 Tax=Aliidongia sp. TaxID=1914230 RepID=UPI002DDCEEAF|nr:SMP-30/gluconolactonase/LRE family protein [Aliidongia sp.]HEV2677272.1 SMP-30/gluconolactonase/LRE family protein [Aliidongia sp.]
MRIECVVPARALVGEGPIWDDRGRVVWWVDIKAPALHRYEPATGATKSWPMPSRLGTVALRERGGLVGAFKDGFALIDPDSGAITPLADPEAHLPGNRFNDGGVDAAGRFWAGTMDDGEKDPTGHLYRLDPDGSVTGFEAAIAITNGLDWSLDGRTFYVADTPGGMILAYDFDMATGRPGARRLFARVPDAAGHPDGLVVDEEDHVWGAHWGGARLTRYRPDGSIERVVAMPAPQVTSACFGGADLDVLYVTTAAIGLDAAALAACPDAGGLFAVTGLGIRGRPSRRFAG